MHPLQMIQMSMPLIEIVAGQVMNRMAKPQEITPLREMIPAEWLEREAKAVTSKSSEPPKVERPVLIRPGCTAADESLLVQAHLNGLRDGRGGFGLLRHDPERLENAAIGASMMGRGDIAEQFREIAEELPNVRDEDSAAAISERIAPLVEESWVLGQKCGLAQGDTRELIKKATAMAKKVAEGEVTREEAIASLQEDLEE